jgi:hypothetical protein
MTTTKIIYVAAAILPFGFVFLGAVLIARMLIAQRKSDPLAAALI